MKKIYLLLLTILFAASAINAQVSVTATAGTTGPTAYTNLSSAFTAINAGTHQGAITIDISASFTDAAVSVLNGNGAGTASYTSVLIRPSADGVAMSFASATGRGVIELNGADNVTIDGDNPNTAGTNLNLTINNTAANTITYTSVIRIALSTLINSADNNIFRNCILVGSAAGAVTSANTSATTGGAGSTHGILVSGGASTVAATTAPSAIASNTTTIAAGQTALNFLANNNTINACGKGIYFTGAAVTVCPLLTITNNIIGNPTELTATNVAWKGISVQGFGAGSLIRGNTIYMETFLLTTPIAAAIEVGAVSANGTGLIIENNTFPRGFQNNTGGRGITGVNLAGGNSHIIRNNFFYNIKNIGSASFSTTFGAFGILLTAGTGHQVYHNSISIYGSDAGTGNIMACIAFTGVATTGCDVRNNIFSNTVTSASTTSSMVCVYFTTAPTAAMALTINNNAYYTGNTTVLNGIGQVTTTKNAANLYLTSNFNPSATTPSTNWRSVTSVSVASNDNASFALTTAAPFTSATNLHIPNGTSTALESSGAAAGVTNDIDGDVRNVATPDIGADEFAGVFLDQTAPSISYTTLSPTCVTGDRAVTGITITDASGVPTTGTLRPRIYYRKNAGAYFSQPGTLASGTGTNGTWNFTVVAADMGGLVVGDIISYYIIAQDISIPANISSNPVGVSATDVNTVLIHPSSPNTYAIGNTLSGTYTVGIGGNYTTLTSAANAYNTGCLGGAVTFNLIDATYPSETFPISIIQNAGASATNTLIIKPAATTTISGSVASGALIRILGNYVTINGSNNLGTSRNLTITNTSTTAPTVMVIGSTGTTPVTNSGLRNCVIINGANTATAVVVSDGAVPGTAGYFNNITVQNNSIQRAYIGNYNIAVVAPGNGSGLLVTQNDLNTSGANSIRLACIYVQGVDGATVSNNNLGNMANTLDAANLTGIWLATATLNTTVSNNIISNISGTLTAPRGVAISSGVAATNIDVTNNTVTGLTASVTQATSGIMLFSTTTGVTIQKNIVRDIKNTTAIGAYGLNLATTSTGAGISVSNNMISDVASLGSATVASNGMGIIVSAGSGYSIYNNTVNLTTNQTTAAGLPAAMAITSGVTAAGAINLRNNIFVNSQTGGSTNRYAIYSAAANTVFAAINYNNYFTAGPNLGFIGSNRVDLAAIQAGFGDNANSVNILPVFMTGTDMHLNPGFNPTLNNLGVTIAGITTDIDNDTRNAATPDMGADEYTPCTGPTTATASSNSPVCAGQTLTLTGVTDGTSYSWTGPNGFTSTSLSPTIPNVTAAAAGTYTFQSFLAGCPSLAATTTVTITTSPTIVSVGASSTSICLGASIDLTSNATSNLPPVTVINEGFEGGAIPAGWISVNAGTGNLWTIGPVNGTPRTGTRSVEYNWNTTQTASAYLITAGVALTGGVTYNVSSWYKGTGTTFPEKMRVTVGTAQTIAAQTTVIQDLGSITTATYTQQSATFTPAVSGTYYFAWNCYSDPDEFHLDLDDILITAPAAPPTYSWTSVPAGFTSNLQNPTGVTPTVTTTYTVTASNGICSASGSVTVTVGTPTVSAVLVQPTTCVSTDGAITLTVSGGTGGVGPYSYAWVGPGVNPTSQNQTNLGVGSYTVTVTDIPSGCTNVIAYALPGPGGCNICPTIPTLTTNPTPAACQNANVTLTASGLTNMGVTYGITFKYSNVALANPYVAGTVIATVPNAGLTTGGTVAATTTTFAAAGNYFIYAILSPLPVDPSCRPFAQTTLTVNANPTVNAVANQALCRGASTTAVNFTGSVPGTVYNWTNSNPSIGLAAAGSGNIASFVATNTTAVAQVGTINVTPSFTSGGITCSGTPISFTITVNPNLPLIIQAVPGTTLCEGDPAALTVYESTGQAPASITHSSSNTITTGIGVSCGTAGVSTAINSYWRVYSLPAFPTITGNFTINSVNFGIEQLSGGTQLFTVRLYTQTGAAFPGGTRTLIASQTHNVPVQNLSIFTATFTTPPTVPNTATIVVEVEKSAVVAGQFFWPGGNAAAETGPSYISAAACAINTPVTYASIGFPNTHLVMALSGTIPGLGGIATGTFLWSPAAGLSSTTTNPTAASPATTTTYTVVRTTVPGGCTGSANITINVNQRPVVTSNPANVTACATSTVTFNATGTGTGLSYQWQESTNGGLSYTNLINVAPYSGVTTATLTITGVTAAMSGYRYRVVLSGTCPPGNPALNVSTAAILTVNGLPVIVITPTGPVCGGNAGISGTQITAGSTAPPIPGTVNFASGPINVAIPEGVFPAPPATAASHTIAVSGIPANATITGVSVRSNITHPYVSDVVMVLRAPNGAILNLDALVNRTNNPGANFVNTVISSAGVTALDLGSAPWTGTFRADLAGATFTAFGFTLAGGPVGFTPTTQVWSGLYATPNGNWTIAAYDAGAPDLGNLTSWDITINYTTPGGAGTPLTYTWSPAAGLYMDASATIPYVANTQAPTVYAAPTATTTYTITGTDGVTGCTNTGTITVIYRPGAPIVVPASATVCAGGTPQQLTIQAATPITQNFTSGTISLAVPDNTANGVSHNINVAGIPGTAVVSAMSVTLNMPHTYPADMIFNLRAPNGQILNLYKHNTNTNNATAVPTAGFFNAVVNSTSAVVFSTVPTPYQYGITAPAGPYKPDQLNGAIVNPGYTIMDPAGFASNAANFASLYSTPNGAWTLAMADGGPADLGTLTSWSLSITYTAGTPPPVNGIWTPIAGLFTDPAGLISYVAGTPMQTVYALPATSTTYSVTVSSIGPDATQTFTNPAPITITNGGSTPYPSSVVVSGLPTTGVSVSAVRLNGISHTWSDDVDIMLQSPTGQNVILMSDVGGASAMNSAIYTFSDAGAAMGAGANPTGTYRPTNIVGTLGVEPDNFPAPGPGAVAQPTPALSLFGNTANVNGTWRLFVVDDFAGDDGSISGGYSIIFNYPTPGCTSPARLVPVTVNTPVTILTQPVSATVCTDKVASFSITVAGTAPTYQWEVSADNGNNWTLVNNGGVYSGATSATLVITAPPVTMNNYQYRVRVNGAAPCGSLTSQIVVLRVNPLPIVVIAASPYTSLLPGLSTTLTSTVTPAGAASYQWLLNGAAVSPPAGTGASLPVNVTGLGTYTLRVTDVNGCSSTSNALTITDSISSKVFIYPNPTNGLFEVRYYSAANNAGLPRAIVIYDGKGSRVLTQSYTIGRPYDRMGVDLRGKGTGVYWVEVVDANGNRLAIGRVVITR